jgi:hypothetical protein
MTESYTKALLRWGLINYLDLSSGLSPRILDELKQFNKVRMSGTAQQTVVIIKSDLDAAISSLAPKRDIWCLISLNITPSMLTQAGRHPQVSNFQKRIINGCMLDPCSGCSGKYAPSYCENHSIIRKMQDYLNGALLSNAKR